MDSSVGIVTRLLTGRLGFILWQRQEIFLISVVSRPALGAHPASYPMGNGNCIPGGYGREADHGHLSSAEDKNGGAMPQYAFMT
jgi:hypothetical protein